MPINTTDLLQWVAVPAGRDAAGSYIVSAVLLPRPPDNKKEADYLEGCFSNWANLILGYQNFTVKLQGGPADLSATGTYVRTRICPQAWSKVFNENEGAGRLKQVKSRANVRLFAARSQFPRRSYSVKDILSTHSQTYAQAFLLAALRTMKQTSRASSTLEPQQIVETMTTTLGVHQSELFRQHQLRPFNFYNFKTVGGSQGIRILSTLPNNYERDCYRLAEDPENELLMNQMETAKLGVQSKELIEFDPNFLEMTCLTRRVTLRNARTAHRAGQGEVYSGYLAEPKLSPKLGDDYLQWKQDGSAPTLRRLALDNGEPRWVVQTDMSGSGQLVHGNESKHDWTWSPNAPSVIPMLVDPIDYFHANTHDQIVYKFDRGQNAWKIHETFDTLQKIQLLRNYPHLMRTLGLTIDLKFELPMGDLSHVDRISVLPSTTEPNPFGSVPTLLEPRTWVNEFYAADLRHVHATWIKKGFYKPQCYTLESLDWEAFAQKLVNSLRTQYKNQGSMLLTSALGDISYVSDFTGVFGNTFDHEMSDYHLFKMQAPPLGNIKSAGDGTAQIQKLEDLIKDLNSDPNWQKRELSEVRLRGGEYLCGVHIRFYVYAVRQQDGALMGIIWQAKAYLPVLPAGHIDPDLKWKPLAGEPPPPGNIMPMPTNSTRGISVVHLNRLKRTAAASADLASVAQAKEAGGHPALPPFNAQTLAMGFLIDVGMKDPSGRFRWMPLCMRQEDYSRVIPPECNIPTAVVTEGMLRSAGLQATDQVPSKVGAKEQAGEEFLPESIATWKGGSMAVSSDLPQHSMEKNALPSAAPDWKLDVPISQAPRGATCVSPSGMSVHSYAGVPPLRFSNKPSENNNQPCDNDDPARCTLHDIHMRIRAVDLAGNSRPIDSHSASSEVKGMNFCRHEVIPAPIVVFKDCPDPCRHPRRTQGDMVIYDCGGSDERFLVPPRATLDTAELHGCFDACRDGRLDGRDLSVFGEFAELCLDSTGAIATVPMPEAPRRKGTPSTGGAKDPACVPVYQKYHRPQRDRPRYFPDPKACVIYYKFTDFTGNFVGDGNIDWYPRGRCWPQAKLVKVALRPARKNTCCPSVRYVASNRELIVELPPGWTGDLELACGIGSDPAALAGVKAMGLWAQFHAGLAMAFSAYTLSTKTQLSPFMESCAQLTAQGAVSLFSPPLKIRCTHAVAAPLMPITLCDLKNKDRADGQTTAELRVKLDLDLKSMGSFKVQAAWDDIDDSKADGPVTAHAKVDVAQFDFQDPVSPCPTCVTKDITQDFKDHKHRVVTYLFQAETRYRDQYPLSDPQFGKGAILQRTEVFKSTRSPDRAVIDYIVPTFGWSSETEACAEGNRKRFRLTRKGGGLRVYLKRGWYSSGANEMFAIVLPDITPDQAATLNACRPVAIDPMPFKAVGKDIAHLLTQWGMDPVVKSTPITALPTPSNFKNACIRANLQLRKSAAPPENPDDPKPGDPPKAGASSPPPKPADETIPVSIAAYPVAYDSSRGAWYADVILEDVPSYNCFIRMAVARYQPHSNANLELSDAILANYAQLAPDRAVTVARDPSDRHNKSIIIQVCAKPTMRRLDHSNSITADIYRRAKFDHDSAVWVIDDELKVVPVEAGGDVLWCGRAVWPDQKGERCLVLREFEEHTIGKKSGPTDGGIIFSAVLEL